MICEVSPLLLEDNSSISINTGSRAARLRSSKSPAIRYKMPINITVNGERLKMTFVNDSGVVTSFEVL